MVASVRTLLPNIPYWGRHVAASMKCLNNKVELQVARPPSYPHGSQLVGFLEMLTHIPLFSLSFPFGKLKVQNHLGALKELNI